MTVVKEDYYWQTTGTIKLWSIKKTTLNTNEGLLRCRVPIPQFHGFHCIIPGWALH